MIRLEEITKSYGHMRVVDEVSFTLPAGATLVLIGPSGCGKSTLLRIVAGLVIPDSGEVFVDDLQLSTETRSDVRDRLGYVIQTGGLFPHLTAVENMTLAARFRGWARDRIQDRVKQLCGLTRFPTDGLSRYPSQLSGGQAQRVGLMRALMTDPDVLLLDEPLGALDPIIRYDLQQELRAIFRQLKKSVLLVTHDLHEADYFGDELVLLKAGRVEQRGSARQLMEQSASDFVAQFVQAQRTSDFGATS